MTAQRPCGFSIPCKEAEQQPAVNLQIARAYLAASDPQIATRDWQFVMDELVKLKKDQTQHRW